MLTNEAIQVGELMFGDGPDGFRQGEDGGIRQAVEDEQALLPAVDEGRLAERLEMLRRIGQ